MVVKKKGFQKVISLGLALAMTVGLCACGDNDGKGSESADSSLAKQYVYSYEELGFPDMDMGDGVYFYSVTQRDDRIYMVMEIDHWSDGAYDNDIKLVSMKADGTDIQMADLEFPEGEEASDDGNDESDGNDEIEDNINDPIDDDESEVDVDDEYYMWNVASESNSWEYTNYSYYVIGDSGNLYAVRNHSFEDYSDPENYVSEEETSICKWDMDGKLLWQSPIENLQSEEEYNYVRGLLPLKDGSVDVLLGGENIYKIEVDADGNSSPKQKLSNGTDILQNVEDFIVKGDGTALITYYDDDWTTMYLTSYDIKTDTVGESEKLPDSFMMTGYSGITTGITTDLVYSTSNGLYGLNAGDEQSVQIMSFINSDLNTTYLNNFAMLDDTHFIAFYYDRDLDKNVGGIFTRRNPEDIPDKKVIVLAGDYLGYDIKNRVFKFNKESDEYRIVVKEYYDLNTADDYNAGATQLNNDIISGSMPDILYVNNSLPMESYISKGLIADVENLINKDEELSKTEFMENVFDAYRVKGKLYYVIPEFYVQTLAGKTSLLGDRTSWTIQEFQDFAASLPEEMQILGDMTRDYFMYSVMAFCGRDFVDVSTGKCNFNSREFIGLLEFANTLPQELSEDYYGEDYWRNYQSQYRENRTALMRVYMSSASDMIYNWNGYFGEDITFVGFPSDGGTGSIIYSNNSLVLSAKSKNLDGAWEFVRYYLTDEYQETLQWDFSISKKVFMEKVQEATERPYYLNEDGEKEEYDYYFDINGESVALEPLSQEQVDKIVDFVTSVNKCGYYNENIQNIITEEAAAFFEGQKSAADVAQIIQSRVQIYVDENR